MLERKLPNISIGPSSSTRQGGIPQINYSPKNSALRKYNSPFEMRPLQKNKTKKRKNCEKKEKEEKLLHTLVLNRIAESCSNKNNIMFYYNKT